MTTRKETTPCIEKKVHTLVYLLRVHLAVVGVIASLRPGTPIIPALNCSNTQQLSAFSPKAYRLINKGRLIGVDKWTFPDEINLVWLEPLGLLDHFPNKEEGGDEYLHGVVGEESGHVPGFVSRVAVEYRDEDHPDKANIGAVGLEPADVGELSAIQILCFAGTVIADERDGDGDVVDES